MRSLDTGSGFGFVRLSPDRRAVAALVLGPSADDHRIDVLSVDGARLGSFAADDAVWLDSDRLLVLDLRTNSATIRDRGGRLLSTVSRSAIGIVAAGPRVLVRTLAGGADAGNEFHELLTDRLGPLVRAPGQPNVLSADGRVLGLYRPQAVVLAGTGSPDVARVLALAMPSTASLTLGDTLVDERFPLLASPDGRWLVGVGLDETAEAFEVGSTRVVSVRGFPVGWAPDGRLVVVRTDASSWLWQPPLGGSARAAVRSGLPPGYPTFGPDLRRVAIVDGRDGVAPHATVRSGHAAVDVPLLAAGTGETVVWDPDGRYCLVETGTRDAQRIESRLLRIDLP